MEFWNSIETLSRITKYLQILTIIVVSFNAIITIPYIIFSVRKTSLEKKQLEKYKEKVSFLEEKTKDITGLEQRTLDEHSRNIILREITNNKGTKVLLIVCNSKESQNYMRQFGNLFKAVNWDVKHFISPGPREVHKMRVGKSSKYKNSASYGGLIKSLKESSIEFESGEFDAIDDYEISFDAGVIEANPYQEVLDKID